MEPDPPDPAQLATLLEAYAGDTRRTVPRKWQALVLRYLLSCDVHTPIAARVRGLEDAAPPPRRRPCR